jgi:Na+/proline symporter
MPLALIDWILIASYFALSLAIGLAYRKRAGSSLEEYFLSGRSLPW